MLLPEGVAIAASREAYLKFLGPIKDDGKLDNNLALSSRVEDITARLIAQAIFLRPETEKWRWSVHVVDDPEMINAWCMAGGRMAIYTGLIEQIKPTDDELAQVMGHEIAHALLSHSAEKISRGLAMQAGLTVLSITQTDHRHRGVVMQGTVLAALLALELPNSRLAETESDELGIELAARAGYDPNSAVSLWKKMKDAEVVRPKYEFLSTHPFPESRMEHLSKLVERVQPFYLDQSKRPVYQFRRDSLTD